MTRALDAAAVKRARRAVARSRQIVRPPIVRAQFDGPGLLQSEIIVDNFAGGHLLGLIRLTGRQFTPEDPPPGTAPWFTGPFGYEVAEGEALAEPIYCRGNRGFWRLPEALVPRVISQLPHWGAPR